jgi:hypothetical protein
VNTALDFSVEGMEPSALSDAYRPAARPASSLEEEWHENRTHAWGGSEMAPLLVAYGLSPLRSTPPTWVLDQSEHYQRLGVPKLLAWKAGLRARPQGDKVTKDLGNDRERELLARWRTTLAHRRIDPATLRHSSSLPRSFLPFVDRRCHRIAVTPDAWARALDRELAMVSAKCTYKPLSQGALPWHYVPQVQAEIGTCGARHGIVVVGEGWVDPSPERPGGPIRAFVVPRDEDMIALQRALATEAWAVVVELRALAAEVDALGERKDKAAQAAKKTAAKACAAAWSASRERMGHLRDPAREQLEDVLSGLDLAEDSAA